MVAQARRGKPHDESGPRDSDAGKPGPGGAPADHGSPPNRVGVPAGLIPAGERPLLVLKPHWWFLILRTPRLLTLCAFTAALSFAAHIFGIVPAGVAGDLLPLVWWGAGLLALGMLFVNALRRHVRWYVLTAARVVRVGGVLRRVRVEIPTSSVRMIAVDEPLVQRAAGVGSILFGSAATGGVEVAWTFIESPAKAIERVRMHLPQPIQEPAR